MVGVDMQISPRNQCKITIKIVTHKANDQEDFFSLHVELVILCEIISFWYVTFTVQCIVYTVQNEIHLKNINQEYKKKTE